MKKRFLTLALFTATMLTACAPTSNSIPYYETTAAAYDTEQAYEKAAVNSEAFDGSAMDNMTVDSGVSGAAITPLQTNRKLIRIVSLDVETTDFDTHIKTINQLVEERKGYIEQSNISGNSIYTHGMGQRYASMTVRIPSNTLSDFVTQVEDNGNVTSKTESTEDVTLQYTDVESRKKSLTIEQDRIWALLEKADSVDAVITLESRLSEIRYQLENMEAQLRTYDNQVDYSTVYLHINEVAITTPTAPDSMGMRIQKGFQRNLQGVTTSLTNFIVWFISSIPSLLLFLVIFALIIGFVFLMVRIITRIESHQKGKKKNTKVAPPLKEQNSSKEQNSNQKDQESQQ